MIDLTKTIDLSTTYLGLKLKTPLVASSSPMCQDVGNVRRMEDAGALKRTGPPWYFVPFLLFGALPWTVVILGSRGLGVSGSRGGTARPRDLATPQLFLWLWILIGVVVLLLIVLVLGYNRLIRLRQEVNTGWANIDVQLQRRAERQRDRRVLVLDGQPLHDRADPVALRADPAPGLRDVRAGH